MEEITTLASTSKIGAANDQSTQLYHPIYQASDHEHITQPVNCSSPCQLAAEQILNIVLKRVDKLVNFHEIAKMHSINQMLRTILTHENAEPAGQWNPGHAHTRLLIDEEPRTSTISCLGTSQEKLTSKEDKNKMDGSNSAMRDNKKKKNEVGSEPIKKFSKNELAKKLKNKKQDQEKLKTQKKGSPINQDTLNAQIDSKLVGLKPAEASSDWQIDEIRERKIRREEVKQRRSMIIQAFNFELKANSNKNMPSINRRELPKITKRNSSLAPITGVGNKQNCTIINQKQELSLNRFSSQSIVKIKKISQTTPITIKLAPPLNDNKSLSKESVHLPTIEFKKSSRASSNLGSILSDFTRWDSVNDGRVFINQMGDCFKGGGILLPGVKVSRICDDGCRTKLLQDYQL